MTSVTTSAVVRGGYAVGVACKARAALGPPDAEGPEVRWLDRRIEEMRVKL